MGSGNPEPETPEPDKRTRNSGTRNQGTNRITDMLKLLSAALALAFVFQQPASSTQVRLQSALDEWRASVQSPGASLGVVTKDGQVFGFASGVSDRATGRAMTPDDLLMTGST